jgi:hypothetical protein
MSQLITHYFRRGLCGMVLLDMSVMAGLTRFPNMGLLYVTAMLFVMG